jgi:UDP-glucose 4-epimerase
LTSVVITGASGFLGQALTRRLATERYEVVSLSRRELPGMQRVRDYADSPDGDFLIHCGETADRAAVNAEGEDYKRRAAEIVKTLSDRFRGRLIYASSGAVYGDAGSQPFSPRSPTRSIDTYTQSKVRNEEIVLAGDGSVARLSNLVGAGMSQTNVLSDILRQVPGTEALRVRDDTPVRDYLAVSDAASAVAGLIDLQLSAIVNVGSGIGTSVRAIAEIILAEANESGREIVATGPSFRRSVNVLDISETKELLNWKPVSPLRTELRLLVNRLQRR